jgi:hypothetical protein
MVPLRRTVACFFTLFSVSEWNVFVEPAHVKSRSLVTLRVRFPTDRCDSNEITSLAR